MRAHVRRPIAVRVLALAAMLVLTAPAMAEAAEGTTIRGSLPASWSRDYERSQTLWVDLAERGDAQAQSALGFLYLIGLWLDQNDREAFHWFEVAAAQDVPEAQYYLGTMFLRGRGVGRNASAAYFWCELSTTGRLAGELNAAHSCRDEASRSMSAEDVRVAALRVKLWHQSRPGSDASPPAAR